MVSKPLRLLLLLGLLFAAPARAQLDLGSPQIPREEIDAYMEPFYRLAATAAGSDHFLPASDRFGWHAGVDAVVVPIPKGAPFDSVDLAALPLFRLGAGLSARGASASGRGLWWRDPRVGDLAVFGAAFGFGRDIPGLAFPLRAALEGSWDRISFSSSYVYHYRGSPLGLADRDVPGDYTLGETLFRAALALSWRRGPWGAGVTAGWEWAAGEFEYLYYDPGSDRRENIVSNLDVPGPRVTLGASWKGLRAELGIRSYPYLSLGWAWVR